VVVDPDRDARRGRVLKTVGIAGTVAGGGLLIGGLVGILSLIRGGNPFAFFWMPFAGGFLLVIAVWLWTAGNLLLRSARFAGGSTTGGPFPPVSASSPRAAPVWSCRRCGNRNPTGVGVCSACGTARA
jgi:hypothetical protein